MNWVCYTTSAVEPALKAEIMSIQQLRADTILETYLPSLPSFPAISFVNILYIVLILGSIVTIMFLIRKVLALKSLLTAKTILFELTPPAETEKTAYTTQQLFNALHDLSRQKSLLSRLQGRKRLFSFEIVSTKETGIRYLVRTGKRYATALKQHLLSYLPEVQVKLVDDYLHGNALLNTANQFSIIELKLTKHFAYPLQKQNTLEEHDPVAYITGVMTKLDPTELISLQIIISPTIAPDKEKMKNMIYRGEDVLSFLNKFRLPLTFQLFLYPFVLLMKTVNALLSVAAGATKIVVNDFIDPQISNRQAQMQYQTQYAMQAAKLNLRPARVITPFEQEAVESIEQKIEQNLFHTNIRLLMSLKDKERIAEREQGFLSSLAFYTSSNDQGFQKKLQLNVRLIRKYLFFLFKNRLLPLFDANHPILSSSEIADLYHFPFSKVTQTENIVKSHAKELPAPLSLKNGNHLDIEFAKNTYGGTTTMIGLSKDERARHMYVIGATGTGKSTMLLSMINQDLKKGNGVCVIDPHGDLAETVINCVPKNRINDLIYFNPFDIKYPIGVNLLELTPGLDEDDSLVEKEFITESVISLFRKVFSDAWSSHPHRIEYILRNTIHTAFTIENPTLFTIFDLLNNPVFQKQVVQKVQDENLKNFWKYEFGKAGDFQKVKMVAPVTARIGRFLFSPSAKRILEQEKSTINFDEILDTKKILICNLAKGNIGEDTSEVMGIMLLNKIQLAALKRARVAKEKREEFYLFVDEFQNFATPSFVQMLSESRKYGLNLIMAEQSTSQQKDRNIVDIILANTGTVVTFRSANPRDEQLLLPQFSPYVQPGEIANLPSYHFYMKKAALKPEEPFSGLTMPVSVNKDSQKLEQLIKASQINYAIKYEVKTKTIKLPDISVESNKPSEDRQVKSGLPA